MKKSKTVAIDLNIRYFFSMQERMEFVVQVVLADSQTKNLLGTAIVVAANQVLTCRHVVEDDQKHPDDRLYSPEQIEIRVDSDSARNVIDITHHPDKDLALLTLDENITTSPATWLNNLTRNLQPSLESCALLAYGYAGDEPDPVQRSKVVQAPLKPEYRGEQLMELQPEGGIRQGFSGGPLMVFFDGQPLCAGINYLGGKGLHSSLTIAADTVLAFLQSHGVTPPTQEAKHILPKAMRIDDLPRLQLPPNPYKGLEYFTEADADDFYGREHEIERFLEQFRALLHPSAEEEPLARILPIIGPSGVGKSSLLHAGLIPALKNQGSQKNKDLFNQPPLLVTLRPDIRPLHELALALARIAVDDPHPIAKTREFEQELGLQNDAGEYDGLRRIADSILSEFPGRKLIIVIDQFEETYTRHPERQNELAEWQQRREAFVQNLLNASTDDNGRVAVIIALRSDFISAVHQYHQSLYNLFTSRECLVEGMQLDGLRTAISEPARKAGYPLNEGTVEWLARETLERDGALPLLQVAMTRIWQGLAEHQSPEQTLHQLGGGLGGILEKTAQEIYQSLSPEEQAIARRILLAMVQPGEGESDTRRRASVDELLGSDDEKSVHAVLHKLQGQNQINRISLGLITLSGDKQTRFAEITHEALLQNWSDFRDWLDEETRDYLRLRRRLENQVKEWIQNKKASDLLWGSTQLSQWHLHEERARNELNKDERAFLQRAKTNAARRKWIALSAFIVVCSLTILAGYNWYQSDQRRKEAEYAQKLAIENQQKAEKQSGMSKARELAAHALRNMELSPIESLLLAAEAINVTYRNDKSIVNEADEAMRKILTHFQSRALRSHKDSVISLAFSTDQRWLASGDKDGIVQLWDMNDLDRDPLMLLSQEISVTSLAFSPDQRWLASTGWSDAVRLWDMNNLDRDPHVLRGHKTAITSLAFSPDQPWLASAGGSDAVRLWDMNDLDRDPHVLRGRKSSITSLAFSPDQPWLASGNKDGIVQLWDINDLDSDPRVLRGHERAVTSLAFSPDQRWLASAGRYDAVRLWDMNDLDRDPRLLRGDHGWTVTSLAFSPDQRWLASAGEDGIVQLWDMNDLDSDPRVLRGHEGKIFSLAFSPNKRWLASAGEDHIVRLWGINDLDNDPRVLRGHKWAVTSLAFSPDRRWLASGGGDSTVRLWDMDYLDSDPRVLRGHESAVTSLAFSTERWLASATWDGIKMSSIVRLWDINDLDRNPHVLRDHKWAITSMAFSPNKRWLASASKAFGIVQLLDMNELDRKPRVLRGHEQAVTSLAFSPDHRWLAFSGEDGTVRLWDMNDFDSNLRVLRVESYVTSLALSPDHRWLASGNWYGIVRLWDMNDLDSNPRVLRGHEKNVFSLAFSLDHRWLASGDKDGIVRLWDMNDLDSNPRVLRGHEENVFSLAFSPDHRWLASASADGTVRLWRQVDDLLLEACRRSGRNFSLEEWQRHFSDITYVKTCNDLPLPSSWSKKALELAKSGHIDAAIEEFQMWLNIDSEINIDPISKTYITYLVALIKREEKTEAVKIYEKLLTLNLKPNLYDEQLNSICWWGGTYNLISNNILDACENAVELAPQDAGLRDSRGLARALIGDLESAIEDFQYFIDWAPKNRKASDKLSIQLQQRQQWIEELKAGKNPFNEQILQELRNQ